MRFGMLVCTALLVMGMCLSAELLESSALIFPEIAALAFGAWATKARPWMATNLDMWLSPSVAGAVGIAVGRWLPLPFACQVAAAFVLVLAWLWVTRSAVLPSISAAILPLVAGETSWIYPLSVCVFTGIIMLVCHVLDWRGIGNYTRVVLKSPPTLSAGRQALVSLLRWGRILAIASFVAWLSRCVGWRFLLAPPLIIACITFVSPGGPFRSRPLALYLTVVACASLGAGLAWCAWQGWMPLFLAAGLACMGSFLVFQRASLPCPPAAALSVLPTIVPEALIPWYPLHIATGAAVFFVFGALLFPAKSQL